VLNRQAANPGRNRNLVIDAEDCLLVHVVLSIDATVGVWNKLIAMPRTAFEFDATEHREHARLRR
jgi:hypothetical protein